MNDVEVIKVGLTPEFDVDVGAVLAAVSPRTKLLFLCSPGNPTAKSIPLATVERLLRAPEYKGLVVLDEASRSRREFGCVYSRIGCRRTQTLQRRSRRARW